MKTLPAPLSCVLGFLAASSIALLSLTGCSGFSGASFPDASVNPAQTPVGTIQGSVYGGHAPLVGAHVYLLSPGTSGYGSQASSLLCDTGTANASCTTSLAQNISGIDLNIPTSWYYETTDATGSFNLTGNYTCTAGNPVYVYAYGGSPTFPSTSNIFTISSVKVTGSASPYTVTMTATTTENAYVGEAFTIANTTGNQLVGTGLNSLSGNTEAVIAGSTSAGTTLTTVQFSFTTTASLTAGTYPQTGTNQVTFSPTNNPGVVNLAVLGVCPSTGSLAAGGLLYNGTTSNAIQYIYLNEVSTAAAAYALEGFTPTTVTGTTNATDIGSSPNNLIGIENAALVASLLYDINGSQITTSYAGEGHIANPKTPNGNGLVPQYLLNTMGNILAACVDSNDTAVADGSSGESAQCKTLFETATSNGVPKGGTGTVGVMPIDTAQAMLNIAHYPAGDPSNTTTFMGNLYGLPSGNVPFTPNLVSASVGQPNDFTVAIQYSKSGTTNTSKVSSAASLSANTFASGPESVAIDSYGNVWGNDLDNQNPPYYIWEISPLGVNTYLSANTGYELGYVTIDPSNNVYLGTNYNQGDEIEVLASGTANQDSTRTIYTYKGDYGTASPFNADGFYNGYMSVANGAGNVYIGVTPPGSASNPNGALPYTAGLTGSMNLTGLPGTTGNVTLTSLFQPAGMNSGAASIGTHGAVENASVNGSGDIWWSNEIYLNSGATTFAVVRVNATTGIPETNFPIKYSSNTSIDRTEAPAIDQSGNFWAAARLANKLVEVTPTGTVSTYTSNTLNTPFGVAIDGGNNLFISQNVASGTAIAEFSINNTTNISPATNGYTLGNQLKTPLNLAMDQSGNLWITTNTNNTVVQWIGAGAPVYNPLSLASKNNGISTRP
jgi:hypothetical protein